MKHPVEYYGIENRSQVFDIVTIDSSLWDSLAL